MAKSPENEVLKPSTFKEKLIYVQATLKAPKSQRNSFGNYNYRKAEDIQEAAKPLLAEVGLLLVLSDELVIIGERYYIKAVATIGDGETELKVSAYAREEESKKGMDGSQVTGASSSYARKYALNGLFLIDDTEDSDATNQGSGEAKQAPVNKTVTKTTAKTETKQPDPAPTDKKDPEPQKDKPATSGKKPLIAGEAAFEQAAKWVAQTATTNELIFDTIDKLKPKYSISDDDQKKLAERVAEIKAGK